MLPRGAVLALALLALPVQGEASEGLDPRIPGGQSAYDARVEVRPILKRRGG